MRTNRDKLHTVLSELSDLAPDLRLGQMLANLATLAQGAKLEAIWDAEDEELLTAARRLCDHFRSRDADVAETSYEKR